MHLRCLRGIYLDTWNYPWGRGISRKSFLSIENDSPDDRLYSSLGALSVAILNGADIVRVHDVEKTAKMIMTIDQMKYNM